MNLLIIDNHDSFTFNLVELCRQAGIQNPNINKNDQIDNKILDQADKIIISPGPGLPSETANVFSVIRNYGERSSILGICLGFQAIIESYGGTLRQLDFVRHGIVSYVNASEDIPLFHGIESPFPVGRYHSWVADTVPESMEITASSEGIVMGVKHKSHDVQGLQFHPESFLTPSGLQLLKNWLGL